MGICEDAACSLSCSKTQSSGLGHVQGRTWDEVYCLRPNGSKHRWGGLAGERRYGNNSEKKQHARREAAGGKENYNTKACNITDFLQQTLSERLALALELWEKCQEFFRGKSVTFLFPILSPESKTSEIGVGSSTWMVPGPALHAQNQH